MIARALVVALCCACALALAPLSAPADDDCALYLTGPGRSSAYDYSLNLLKGNFGYEGQHTCITYEAINQAYLDARNRILVSQPKGDWKAEDFASVGELLLDISINLARTYGLTYEEIEKGLPLIDTSRTLIREACPPVFSHVECRAGKYRRFDGLCNNLRHPTWGATMAPFQRLIGPLFADGINAPRIAHNGHDLPLSRVVSRTMHPDDGFHDHAGTVMVIAWGQFMDHDYTLTGTPLDPINRNDPEECCKRPPHLKHPYCNEIRVPDDDYFYRLWGVKCIDFVRGFPSPRPGCRLGSRVPFNTLTGSIDGNTVYGVTEKFARKLRTGYGGLLRMNPVFKEYGLKDLLPLKLDIPDEGCTRPNKNMYCFEAGEIRVNEQLVLTVMHTLMAREHNRVAEGLAGVNPHWDDETLFQEARRINIAEIQHITYNEFLPILLGKDVMEKFGLVLEKEGYWNGYDPEVNPDVLASFAAAAYRFGHSLLPTAVERWSKAHKFIASKRLSDLIRRPYDLYRAGVLDEYVMGLMNQVAQAMDDSITQEVTNHLFKKVGARFGMDLVSFNMQRGREFGLPGYMEFRKFCGLSGADTFQELFGSMPNETVRKYESIFEHPIDVDLWSGGVSERPLPGSMLGPTFACIIATQFSYSRRGDRFWFELPNQPSSFTSEQLAEIRKSRLARVICDNTDIIDTVQLYPMVLPDHELNPRVPCRSGIIPTMDFSKWAEPVPFHGTAKQFITDAIASNKYVNYTENDINAINTEEKNKTPKEVEENPAQDNLCNPITSPENGKIEENISFKLHINQTSKPSNNKRVLEDCKNDINNKTICKTESTKINPIENKILKFVYTKTNKKHLDNKTQGHSKNRISRRRRSIEIEPTFYKRDLPVPYGTRKTGEFNLPTDNNGETIKKTHRADFNIETLHKDSKLPKNNAKKNNYNAAHSNIDNSKSTRINKEDNRRYEPLIHDSVEERKNTYKLSDENSRESDESNESIYNDNHKSSRSNPIPYGHSLNTPHSKHVPSSDIHNKPNKGHVVYSENLETKGKSNDEINKSHHGKLVPYNESYKSPQLSSYDENPKVPYSEKIIYDKSLKPPPPHSKPTLNEESTKNPHSGHIPYSDHHKALHSNISPYADNHNVPYSGETQKIYENNEFRGDLRKEHKDNAKITDHLKKNHINTLGKSNYVPTGDHDKDSYSKEVSYEVNKSTENSSERPLYRTTKPNKIDNNKNDPDHIITPRPIQDVDLGDFSYERIQVNDKGKVEPITDSHDNYDSLELIQSTTVASSLTSDKSNQLHAPRIVNVNSSVGDDFRKSYQQLAKIKDGEVKPVVELSNENSNSESSEENSRQSQNSNLQNNAKYGGGSSEENQSQIKETQDKLNDYNGNNRDKANVKEQFERIPLDYNHDDKSQTETEKTDQPAVSKDNSDENINDGTLDSLAPKTERYDENLNIKFGDVSIKLPEIKLPDDILSYARIGAPKEGDNNSFYQYGDEVSEENPIELRTGAYKNHDFDTIYNSYKENDHEDYKKPTLEDDEDDDDVDLYEKFVKERFGKESSFGKKSEKLQAQDNKPLNSKLLENVRKILKKTEQVQSEAEKSGDPNAGYMWTLEYGQDL